MSAVQRYIDQNFTSAEGRRGLVNLARLCRVLGYRDPTYSGQLDRDASLGDIVMFLEDNSGAIEAMLTWVARQRVPEWEAGAEAEVGSEDDEG